MTHGFRNNVLIGHDLAGGKDAVLEETLQKRHLFRLEIVDSLSSNDLGAHLVELFANELARNACQAGTIMRGSEWDVPLP